MGCGTNIVPGYKEFNNSADKDPGLEMKMNQLLSERVLVQENSGPLEGYNEVGAMFVNMYKGGRMYAPTKKVVLYHGTPASNLEGGSFNLNAKSNQGGGSWMKGIHATPDINTAQRYHEEGGSVYAVGYNINKVWHLRGNEISDKLLKDYERALRATGMGESMIEHNLHGFARNGQLKGLNPEQQRQFLLKNGYNLVLDGSTQVVMLEPSESGTSPLRLNDREIRNARRRRKKGNKSLRAYLSLIDNKEKSDRRRENIDKQYKKDSYIRFLTQMGYL